MSAEAIISAIVTFGAPLLVGYILGVIPGMVVGERLLRSRDIGYALDALKTFAAFLIAFYYGIFALSFANASALADTAREQASQSIDMNSLALGAAGATAACVGHFLHPWKLSAHDSRVAPFVGAVVAASYLGIAVTIG